MKRYQVFSRLSSTLHPFEPVLERWLSRLPPDPHSAMACNLIWDHRVTPERAEKLLSYFASSAEPDPEKRLEKALQDYLDKEIRHRKAPSFRSSRLNELNLMPQAAKHFTERPAAEGRAAGPSPSNRDTWLARVIDLNGLVPVFRAARFRRTEPFKDFPLSRSSRRSLKGSARNPYSQDVLGWLDHHLLGRTTDQKKEFVAASLGAMEEQRKGLPHQPSWATYWKLFERYVPDGPECWASVLGITNPRRCDRWLMVLKYPLRAVDRLVRPTILDAGFYPYHFPSPPQAVLGKGGHPMDLRRSAKPDSLLAEFIHEQIPHPLVHWEAAGALLDRTRHPLPGWLAQRRSRHLRQLTAVYGDEVNLWMERCT